MLQRGKLIYSDWTFKRLALLVTMSPLTRESGSHRNLLLLSTWVMNATSTAMSHKYDHESAQSSILCCGPTILLFYFGNQWSINMKEVMVTNYLITPDATARYKETRLHWDNHPELSRGKALSRFNPNGSPTTHSYLVGTIAPSIWNVYFWNCPRWNQWRWSRRRLEFVNGIPLLSLTDKAREITKGIMNSGLLPEKATQDAIHIAVSAVHQVDILLTWNCKHIANAVIMRELEEVVGRFQCDLPILCTPDELLEGIQSWKPLKNKQRTKSWKKPEGSKKRWGNALILISIAWSILRLKIKINPEGPSFYLRKPKQHQAEHLLPTLATVRLTVRYQDVPGASAIHCYKWPNSVTHRTPLEEVGHWSNENQIYCQPLLRWIELAPTMIARAVKAIPLPKSLRMDTTKPKRERGEGIDARSAWQLFLPPSGLHISGYNTQEPSSIKWPAWVLKVSTNQPSPESNPPPGIRFTGGLKRQPNPVVSSTEATQRIWTSAKSRPMKSEPLLEPKRVLHGSLPQWMSGLGFGREQSLDPEAMRIPKRPYVRYQNSQILSVFHSLPPLDTNFTNEPFGNVSENASMPKSSKPEGMIESPKWIVEWSPETSVILKKHS